MYKLLSKLNTLNVVIKVVNDKLDITAPKGVVTKELLGEIKGQRAHLIKFITAQESSSKMDYSPISPLPPKEGYVLSSSQKRLWILSHMKQSNLAYNMSNTFRIKGELDVESLKNVFITLIERHEILRTNFRLDALGNVTQIVFPISENKFVLSYEDLSDKKERKHVLEKIINKEETFLFDLSSDALLRVKLLKLANNSYMFNMVMHHVISDAWSMQILCNEIFTLYDAFVKGNKNPFQVLTIQYKDYAEWQQENIKKGVLNVDKAYWIEQFKGDIPTLNLPGAKAIQKTNNYQGKLIKTLYDLHQVQALKKICEHNDSSLFIGLLGLVKLMLFKYTNKSDIIVGIPVSGREHPDLQEQIGFYVNLLGLRTRIEKEDNFITLIQKLNAATLLAYNHQNYPFDLLLENLSLEKNTLFDNIVTLENVDHHTNKDIQVGEISLVREDQHEKTTSKFGLEFVFKDTDCGLDLELTYNIDVYEDDFALQITKHLEVILDSIIKSPEATIDTISLLSKEAKQNVLIAFNNSKMPYPKSKTFIDAFKQQVNKSPNSLAVIYGDEAITYKELDVLSNNLAYYLLKAYNIEIEQLVGVKLKRSKWLLVSFLGVLKCGGAYLPIDPNYPEERIKYIEKDSECRVVIDKAFIDEFNHNKIESNAIAIKVASNDLAYVIYTSGSTGKPKGVVVEHQNLMNLCNWHIKFYNTNELSKSTLFSGIAFDASIWEICPYLMSGGTLYIIEDGAMRIDPFKLSSFLQEKKITHSYLPTQICQSLVDNNINIENLKVLTGGDELKLGKDTNIAIYNNYGPTENTVVTTCYKVQKGDKDNIPIGKPIANTQVYILDNLLNPLPIGFTGRLFVSGDNITRGYLNQLKLTTKKFFPSPFVTGERLYDTGDLAKWLPDGNIVFKGRSDNQVKIRGFRVELGEIEYMLLKQKEIKRAFVTLCNVKNEEHLVAYVLFGEKVEAQKLRLLLQNELPLYMVPCCFIEINAIPLTANGKIDKKALPNPTEKDFSSSELYTAPQTALEIELVKIWSQVTGINTIGIDTVLFNIGGSSISIVKIINRIKQELGFELKFENIYENPTIRGIIPFLKQRDYTPIPVVSPLKDYGLNTAQTRFWILCQMPEINKAYTIPFVMKLIGALDLTAMQNALFKVVERHETLRTCFIENSKGEIRQQIVPMSAIDLKIEFLELENKSLLNNEISKFFKIPYDLTQAPLLKVQLIKIDKAHYYLALKLHHIIFDGQSLQILIKELSSFYNSYLWSSKLNLPDLRIQYKDYAAWANTLVLKTPNKEFEFWMNELEGELPILNFPTYQKRPLLQTYKGNSITKQFDLELFEKVNIFSEKHQTTPFVTLLSALKGLFYRYTNQTDILVGTPLLGREHPDLENQIGLYINTLPIRTRFNDSSSFKELVAIQKNTVLRAHSNSNCSFGDIINGLNIQRDTSRSPLFDILVIYQNQEDPSFDLKKRFNHMECSVYSDSVTTISKYDITFSFLKFKNHFSLSIEYNTDLYENTFIADLVINFESFLDKCLESPTQSIRSISYLNKKQTHQLTHLFNNTIHVYNSEKTIVDLFKSQAVKSLEKVALVCRGKSLTYKELDDKSTQLSHYLKIKGVEAGASVGLFLGRSNEMVIAILGVLKSGACYLPLDPFYPIARTDYILKDSNTKFVIADSTTQKILPEGATVINMENQRIWNQSDIYSENKINNLSPAYIIYTSGSTGKPKGVQVSHKNLSSFIEGMNNVLNTGTKQDVWLAMTSISFDISILELLWTITQGNKVVIHLEKPSYVEPKAEINFSLFYFPAYNNSEDLGENKYKLLIEGAKFADKKGFEAIWVPERHFHNFGDQFPNPSVAAAAVSTITKNIKLRSGSVVLPLHDPVRVAEEWSMVDNLSEGRVELSIASGWHPNDFVLAPNDYENRSQIMKDGVTTLKNIWEGNPVTRKNGIGKDFKFFIHPVPVQKKLKLWITAAGNIETFKYAASIGANILTHLLGQNIDELAEKIKVYREVLRENGYDPKNYKVALMVHTFVSDDIDFVKQTVEKPFKNYLKNSLNLLKPIAEELQLDLNNDLEPLLDIGYKKFYKTSSLFGTPESCLGIINKIHKADVNEIACLIDFGIEEKLVIDNLDYLNELKNAIKRSKAQYDYIVDRINLLRETENTIALIHAHNVTHIQATPSFYEEFLLTSEGKKALQHINTLLVGGEVLKKSLAKALISELGRPIYNMYGPTETTIWSSVKEVSGADDVTIGKPIANTKIYILDHNNQLCPIGVSGELCIGGDGVSLGYFNNKELTNSRFIENPFDDNQKMYKTGDLARWLPNGDLEYHGRLDSQVKFNGYRIELKEIENVILEHKAIVQCTVMTLQEKGQRLLVAYIKTLKNTKTEITKELLGYRLPHYMIPQRIIVLKEFPKTPNGKTDFKALAVYKEGGFKTNNYTAPRNINEKKISKIWSDFLKIERLSIDDNFFEIGGNSIKAFQLLSILKKALAIDLKIFVFFQYPTVRTMAEKLYQEKASKKVEIEENEMEDIEDLMDFMSDL